MNPLVRILLDNPILLVVAVVWLLGAIGGARKAAAKRAGRVDPPEAGEEPSTRSPDDVAREMRRILGMEEPEREPPAPPRRPVVAEPPPLRESRPLRREIARPERAPTPVLPSMQARKLPKHVDPHVGDAIAKRVSPQSGRVGQHDAGQALGSLGGRVHASGPQRRADRQLVDLGDLRRAFVTNEILGLPLSLRPPADRL